ncbi:MAG TPA: hypothetical protein DCP31_28690 [Cyanobacteria bacterium UBA8543]|nr:hypothetical protein [Cyanobacteria bacterium UBA8543]
MPRAKGQPVVGDELKQQFSCSLTPSSHENLKQLAAHLQFASFSALIEALGTHQFILAPADSVDVEEQVLALLPSANTEERIRTLKTAIERFCA